MLISKSDIKDELIQVILNYTILTENKWRSTIQVPTYFVYSSGQNLDKIAEQQAKHYGEIVKNVISVHASVVDYDMKMKPATYFYVSPDQSPMDPVDAMFSNPEVNAVKIKQEPDDKPSAPVDPYIKKITKRVADINKSREAAGNPKIIFTFCDKEAEILQEAAREAVLKSMTTEDGGTCNLDHPYLPVPEEFKATDKMTNAVKKWIESVIGCSIFYSGFSFHGRRFCVYISGVAGQANAHAAGVKAFRDCLQRHGYDCGIYYQMD